MKTLTALEKKKKGYLLSAKDKRELKFIVLKDQLEKEYGKKLTKMQIRYLEKGIRYQLIYDIETTDFNPRHNWIICYVARMRDIVTGKVVEHVRHVSQAEIKHATHVDLNFDCDKKLLQDLSKLFKQADQVIGHFSTKYDDNYFFSRCLLSKQGHLYPEYQDIMHGDTWRMMKSKQKAPRNTLNNFILQTTGKSQKTYVDLNWWQIVKIPNHPQWQKAMNYIVDHCVKDVKMTLKGLKTVEKHNLIQGSF